MLEIFERTDCISENEVSHEISEYWKLSYDEGKRPNGIRDVVASLNQQVDAYQHHRRM
jgi:hypothetical protein